MLAPIQSRFYLPDHVILPTGTAGDGTDLRRNPRHWTSGASLSAVLRRYPQDPGDFVARCRRAIDLLRQMGAACPNLKPRAQDACKSLDRGLVRARL